MSTFALAPPDVLPGQYRACICGATTGALVDTGIDVGPNETRIYLCAMCATRLARAHSLTISDATLRQETTVLRSQLDELGGQLEKALQSVGQRDQRIATLEQQRDRLDQRDRERRDMVASAVASLQRFTRED